MPSRVKILEAAARVYAAKGYRGATTRRIAQDAGVNEVTLFRHFGSKAALIDEALRRRVASEPEAAVTLPVVPVSPERELTRWCTAQLDRLRSARSLICMTMSDLEERRDVPPCAAESVEPAARELKCYMLQLRAGGFLAAGAELSEAEAHAAGTMLMSALLGDAMGRDMMPDLYPRPVERAPSMYVRVFLRAIRCRADSTPVRAVDRTKERPVVAAAKRAAGRRDEKRVPSPSSPRTTHRS